jgi:hypothetical protein
MWTKKASIPKVGIWWRVLVGVLGRGILEGRDGRLTRVMISMKRQKAKKIPKSILTVVW